MDGNSAPTRLVTCALFSTDAGSLFILSLGLVLAEPATGQGQFVIRHGGMFNSRTFYNGNPNTAAVDIETADFVYFYNCTFESAGLALRAFAGNTNI
jgi:hypothetical protein